MHSNFVSCINEIKKKSCVVFLENKNSDVFDFSVIVFKNKKLAYMSKAIAN